MPADWKSNALVWLLVCCVLATAWSAIDAHDYATWFFELLMGGAGIAVLAASYGRLRFSYFVYAVVAVHYIVLAVGAKYTYADEPLFN